jgi:hypothetical protein
MTKGELMEIVLTAVLKKTFLLNQAICKRVMVRKRRINEETSQKVFSYIEANLKDIKQNQVCDINKE